MSSWKQQNFARDYADNAADVHKNWFEHDLNFPLLIEMLPKNAQRVLDYGCGPGEFTSELAKRFPVVEGCDYSDEMIKLAQASYPNCKFFVWDNLDDSPQIEPYDAVFSKLTLQFVDDLSKLAKAMKKILKTDGRLVFSVPHPFSTINKIKDYWATEQYDTEIGSYDMQVTMTHRSLRDYLLPFIENGYALIDVAEPKITKEQAEKHGEPKEKLIYPRRLNLSFKKL